MDGVNAIFFSVHFVISGRGNCCAIRATALCQPASRHQVLREVWWAYFEYTTREVVMEDPYSFFRGAARIMSIGLEIYGQRCTLPSSLSAGPCISNQLER